MCPVCVCGHRLYTLIDLLQSKSFSDRLLNKYICLFHLELACYVTLHVDH